MGPLTLGHRNPIPNIKVRNLLDVKWVHVLQQLVKSDDEMIQLVR